MALAKKADDMIAAIPDLPVQQMIDDLATDLFAVERLDAAEWPSRQEGIRDGFQALGEKLHVMIRGLEHWPAGRALPTILRGGVYAVDSETLYRYGLTINEPPAGPVGGGPAIEGRQKRGRGRVIETMNAAVLAGMLLEQFIENRQSVIARTFDPSRGAMHYGGKKGPPKPPDSDKPTTPAPPRMRHRHGSSHESAPAPQRSVLDDLQEGLSRLLDLGPQESLAHLIRSIIQALESLRDLSKPETTTGAPASDDSPMPIQTAPARRIVNKFVQLAEAAILPVAMETLRALGRLISQNALIHELDAVFRALPPDVIQKDFSLFEATSHRVEIDMLGAFIQLFNTLQAGFDQVIYFELGTLLGDRLNALGTMVRARANVPGRVRKTTVRNLLWPMMMDCLHAIICGGPDRDRLPTQRDAAAWLSWFESDAFLDEAARILRAHPLTSRIARRAA